jgi:hypothetical protein
VVGGREPTPIQPAVLVGPSGLVQGAATPVLDAFYADPLARPWPSLAAPVREGHPAPAE